MLCYFHALDIVLQHNDLSLAAQIVGQPGRVVIVTFV